MNTQVDGILLIDRETAGALPQPFEQDYKLVVVVDEAGADIRQYEAFKPGRYAIHHERMDTGEHVPVHAPHFESAFVRSFEYVRKADPLDLRAAVKYALKAGVMYSRQHQ